MKHQHHFIYRTTCLITGNYYVGMHSTNKLDDRYFGSGRIIRSSLRKYGKENHVLETLEWCQSREELALREKAIINHDMLADPKCMNLVRGGNTTLHEYNRNPASAKLQSQSLRRHFTVLEHRERQRRVNTKACQRLEVIKRIAKKLTIEDVLEIRRLYALGNATFADLASRFNVSGNTIWMVVTRKTWMNV